MQALRIFLFLSALVSMDASTPARATSLGSVKESGGAIVDTIDSTAYDIDYKEHDPFEPLNRGLYGLHVVIDGVVIAPLSYLYNETVPDVIKDGVSNFLGNLLTPLSMLNNLLTLDIEDFGISFARMLINSTIGVLGFFDPASEVFGMHAKRQSFGDTLGKWGIGHGPFIFLPILGPSTVRNTVGQVGDYFGDPYNIALKNNDSKEWIYIRSGITGIDRRRKVLKLTEEIEKTSDPYAQYRSLYLQNIGVIDTASQDGPAPEGH